MLFRSVMGFDCVCGRRLVVESSNGVVASPPKREWQGLTDEQISGLRQQHGITSDGRGIKEWTQVVDFAKAIEAKLKEKNT